MPSGTSEGKKFLGYEWSDTKGNEGIKYLHVKKNKQSDEDEEEDGNAEDDDTMQQIRGINGIVTPLFNPANLSDEQKINSLIRKNFLGEDIEIPDELENYVTLGNLVEMLDFKSTAFKKELKTNVSLKVEVQSHYPIVKLKDYCDIINPSKEEIRNVAKDTVVSFVEMASLGFGKIDYGFNLNNSQYYPASTYDAAYENTLGQASFNQLVKNKVNSTKQQLEASAAYYGWENFSISGYAVRCYIYEKNNYYYINVLYDPFY